jgi:Type II secretion system (T2SS), protein E, N-terminal domain
VKGAKQDTISVDGQGGRLVAERWGLTFREAHTLSIDPAALELVDREESRRLRVLPLELGPEGPVFAVAEPSEERFAAVRDMAGENASFVVVARETLDALLNSKVFGVPVDTNRRGSLPWGRERRTTTDDASQDAPEEAPAVVENTAAEASAEEPAPEPEHAHGHAHAHATGMPNPLDDLLTRITTEAGHLRAQITELTGSLEAAQAELREANEQLAAAQRSAEGHDDVVNGLHSEVAGLREELAGLREQLAGSTSMNETTTARLEAVMRALTGPGAEEAGQ